MPDRSKEESKAKGGKQSAAPKQNAGKKVIRKKVAKKKVLNKAVAKKTVAKPAAKSRRAAGADRMSGQQISNRDRYEMIAKMAYFRAEKRGFEPGWEQQDWLESERLIDEMLGKAAG